MDAGEATRLEPRAGKRRTPRHTARLASDPRSPVRSLRPRARTLPRTRAATAARAAAPVRRLWPRRVGPAGAPSASPSEPWHVTGDHTGRRHKKKRATNSRPETAHAASVRLATAPSVDPRGCFRPAGSGPSTRPRVAGCRAQQRCRSRAAPGPTTPQHGRPSPVEASLAGAPVQTPTAARAERPVGSGPGWCPYRW